MEEIFESIFKTEKVPHEFRERLLQNLLIEVEKTKGRYKRPWFNKVDLLFAASCLASIGLIVFGFIVGEQTWINSI
ncbi:MAG: hypothetical protein JSV32_08265 [Dehalococcoidia bacterium]|nr:MAG: hypothetical protein JSV32_08265 [Dehalococcoidia bacterium]